MTVVTAEAYPYYKRERIAGLISGDETEESLFEKGKDFYQKIRAELVSRRVTGVSTEKNQLILDDDSTIDYDSLLIASGGKPIPLRSQGAELEGISALYTIDDAKRISKLVKEATNIVVVGGGTIAMKVVPIFRRIGLKATLVEKADGLWPTALDKKASEILESNLREDGAEVVLNEEIAELQGKGGRIQSVSLKSQRRLPCDLLLLTTGMRPSVDFLKRSAIRHDLGVPVDHHMRTNIPNVYAAGDVAQVPDPLLQAPALHPTWDYAEEQGEIAANNMVGVATEYEGAVPLFSLGLYDIGVLAAGISQPQADFEELSAFSPQASSYRRFLLQRGRLVGVTLIGKGLGTKTLKPQLKKALLKTVDVGASKTDLLKENFDFSSLLKET